MAPAPGEDWSAGRARRDSKYGGNLRQEGEVKNVSLNQSHEKLGVHVVGDPGGEQVRETVEPIKCADSFFGDYGVDSSGEGCETLAGIKFYGFI